VVVVEVVVVGGLYPSLDQVTVPEPIGTGIPACSW
jgi:hypothetical protein